MVIQSDGKIIIAGHFGGRFTNYNSVGRNHIARIFLCDPMGIPGVISGASIICLGTSNIYTVANVPGAISYNWSLSNGWSGSSSTNFISVTANSSSGSLSVAATNTCGTSAFSTLSITVNTLPTITVNDGAICGGQSFTMVPTGATTYTYSNGTDIVTPTADATYSVSGTDANGCVSNVDAVSSVTVNVLPTLLASTTNTLLCIGETATLSVTGATSYTWSTSDNTSDIVVTPTVQITYTVDGIDANGCVNSTTIMQDVSLCTGINSSIVNQNAEIGLYPNPNNGLFTIDLTTTSQVSVTNDLGEVVIAETMEAGKHNIDIHNQSPGIYFVKVILDGKQHVAKFIKE